MKADIIERADQMRRGEVPKGYKQAFPYIVPKDWSVVRLGELTARTSRRNKSSKGILACSINNQVGFVSQSEQFDGGSYIGLDKTDYKVVFKGEFSYNPARINVGSIGRLSHVDKAIVSSLYVCFKVNGKLDGDYFEKWVNSYEFYKEVIRNLEGTVREYLFYENFSNIKMPLPPISEQRQIAEILNHYNKVIELKKQFVEEKRRRKKWLLQNLLDPDSGVKVPGFEGHKWQSRQLLDLFTFGSSLSASREQLGKEGICYLHYGDIHTNKSYYIDVSKSMQIIPKLNCRQPEQKTLLRDGDVAFVDASEDYDGVCKYILINNPENVPFISGLHTIPAHSKTNELTKDFKQYCFQSNHVKKQMFFYAAGAKVLGLSKENLGKIVVQYPSVQEQIAIANVLSTADSEIELLEQDLAQWQLKKKSLMQLLLTGIVRVPV